MMFDLLIHLTNFGLVILIWMVQLIIYPGFEYYNHQSLFKWHKKYTARITVIVLPLMVSQLGLHLFILRGININYPLMSLSLVLATWVVTFIWAVPLHGNIGKNIRIDHSTGSLIRINWSRTALWSIIFALDLLFL